jgi:hypothetical protein
MVVESVPCVRLSGFDHEVILTQHMRGSEDDGFTFKDVPDNWSLYAEW